MTFGRPDSQTVHALQREALDVPGLDLHGQLRHGVDTLLATGLLSAREERTMETFLETLDGSLGWGLVRHVAEAKTARATSAS